MNSAWSPARVKSYTPVITRVGNRTNFLPEGVEERHSLLRKRELGEVVEGHMVVLFKLPFNLPFHCVVCAKVFG